MHPLLAFWMLLSGCGSWKHWMTLPSPSEQPPAPAVGQSNPPAGARLHYALAVNAWLEGELFLARTEVAVARLLDPGSAWLWLTEGRMAAHQGDREGAGRALREALRLDPSLVEARDALEALGTSVPAGGGVP